MATIELDDVAVQGQAEIWRFMFSYVNSMALKSAVELRIADIIHSHGGAITLSQIASCINGGGSESSPDITTLARIMRLLVRRKIFTVHHPSDGGDPVYDLTHSSRWLLHDSEQTLAPMKAHGREVWDLASDNPEFNGLFNDAMSCSSKVITRAILSGYKERLSSIGSLVDVGGGTGSLISEIVKAYPHIKVVNFDLQHVVWAAPPYGGVSHIAGNMFRAIPNADGIIMMVMEVRYVLKSWDQHAWILHDWGDEDCIQILRYCMIGVILSVFHDFLRRNGNGKCSVFLGSFGTTKSVYFEGSEQQVDVN
ncbi:O-methyltransferase [Hibiscus syriacus]|uniref:O-methyltransferase n=1 Tax=Hibiscus syriacus TaxID=106335 RepID=A0A6A2YG63_HIBSY|nr:O-methyltransferase [Hibiscus syriacus]